MAKNNPRDPNLRAATVARVNQLVKGGLTKAAAFEKISSETGRAKDAVQMLYYRAVRAGQGGAKKKGKAAKSARVAPRAGARRAPSASPSGEFPKLLGGIAAAINALLIHIEKTVEENKALKEQARRLSAIASLLRAK